MAKRTAELRNRLLMKDWEEIKAFIKQKYSHTFNGTDTIIELPLKKIWNDNMAFLSILPESGQAYVSVYLDDAGENIVEYGIGERYTGREMTAEIAELVVSQWPEVKGKLAKIAEREDYIYNFEV